MVTTWEVIRARCRRFVSDVLDADGARAPRISEQELADAWNDVQDDLVLYAARPKTFTVAAGQTTAKLPNDLYRIERVVLDEGDDENHYIVLQLDAEGSPDDINAYEGTYWYKTTNRLIFTQELDYAVTVFYRAYYPEIAPSDNAQPVHVPRWAIQACVYYVAAVTVGKQVIADPQLRQWANRRQDAGNPTHNPFLQVAKYCLGRYREKVFARTQGDTQERTEWHSSFP
jgi:hypothetical protein